MKIIAFLFTFTFLLFGCVRIAVEDQFPPAPRPAPYTEITIWMEKVWHI